MNRKLVLTGFLLVWMSLAAPHASASLVTVCVNGEYVTVEEELVNSGAVVPTNDCDVVTICYNGALISVTEYMANQLGGDTGDCGYVQVCVNGQYISVTQYEINIGLVVDTGDCGHVEICVNGQYISVTQFEVNTGQVYDTGDCGIITICYNGQYVSVTQYELNTGAVIPTNDCGLLTVNDMSIDEGNSDTTSFTFTVSLSTPAGAGGVTFDIATTDGTATAPSDYTAKSLTGQTIPAGSSTYTFTVMVNGDTTPEANETFFVNITNVTGANVADGQGQGTITNDDAYSFAVTYNGNGNTGGTAPTDGSSPYLSGGTVTVLGNTGTLVKSGYTFTGWNTEADGSGTSYSPGNTFAMGSSDVTLYAQWLPIKISSVIVDPAMPLKLYAGVDGNGVYRSTDSGSTWTAATTQPDNPRIKGLVMKPGDSSILFTATYGSGVYKSIDSGDAWSQCLNTDLGSLNATVLATDPTGKLYAGTEAGIYTSNDCDTWSATDGTLPATSTTPPAAIAIDSMTVTNIYAGLYGGGIYRSTNGGTNWTAATIQPTNLNIKAVVINPADSTGLYAATYGGGVYTSTDSGDTWSACASQPTNMNTISLTIDSSGKLYSGTEDGVFVSADGCATWTAMNAGLPN